MRRVRRLDHSGRVHSALRSISPASRTMPSPSAICARESRPSSIFVSWPTTMRLTGLAEPQQLQQEARSGNRSAHRRTGPVMAVLCLDLDRFKEVNDLFGHAAGDVLLQNVAKVRDRRARRSQMTARLGGDEFAIIVPEISGPRVAGRVAENIIEALRDRESNSAATCIHGSASIGIAICPERCDRPPMAPQPRRHRALSRQNRGTRHLPILRSRDGRGGARPPPAGA